jgi:hypothetical protein
VIPEYARGDAPAIALPAGEHGLIPNLKGVFSGTPDDLLGRDIANLRDYTGAPESSIQQLLDLIGRSYPDSFGGG